MDPRNIGHMIRTHFPHSQLLGIRGFRGFRGFRVSGFGVKMGEISASWSAYFCIFFAVGRRWGGGGAGPGLLKSV